MESIKSAAHGKINWTLEVLGVRPDGYHDLKSIVLPIALHDDIEVATAKDGIEIFGCGDIPKEKNLIYKAAMKLAEYAKLKTSPGALGDSALPQPVLISVVKRIPAGGGLGGGSSDAAITLRLLNEFWNLQLAETELIGIAAEVGSDVPALLLGGPVMMEGRGERVRRLSSEETVGLPTMDQIEIFTPPIFSSTPAVYREFRESDRGLGRNDLQPAALRLYPKIADALKLLEAKGLQNVAMSGSGSTVYGVRQ